MTGNAKMGLDAFKSAINLVKRLRGIPIIEAQRQVIDDLQTRLLNSHAAYLSLHDRHHEMAEELMKIKDWQIEAERYELVELPPRIYVRSVKESARGEEPPHYLCADCYNRQVKSLLHGTYESGGQTHYTCHSCHTVFKTGHYHALPSGKVEVEYDLHEKL